MHILHNKEKTLVTTISEYCTTSSNIACMSARDDANITMYPPLCCPLLYIILSSLPLLTITPVQLSDLRAGDEWLPLPVPGPGIQNRVTSDLF